MQMSHLLGVGGRPEARGKVCRKQTANEITDLYGSKRCQELQRDNERITAATNAYGEVNCDRQHQQCEGDYAKTYSKKKTDRSSNYGYAQHAVPQPITRI
jgi:hypothetical protein